MHTVLAIQKLKKYMQMKKYEKTIGNFQVLFGQPLTEIYVTPEAVRPMELLRP